MGLDIIILTKDKTDYLFNCLDSIINATTIDYHVYIGDTGSSAESIAKIAKYCKDKFPKKNVSLIKLNYYNFAKNNNHIANNYSTNDYILFCNNDVEFTDPCVDELYKVATQSKTTGSVGCKLIFPNGKIQHAGQFAFTHKPEQAAGWTFDQDKLEVSHRGINEDAEGFSTKESVLGNTGAMLMVSKQAYDSVNGFPETYIECFEDVEFNMRLKLAGYDNVYVGYVKAIHHESTTRGKDKTAMLKLATDYLNGLFPYWNKLTHDQQQLLTQ